MAARCGSLLARSNFSLSTGDEPGVEPGVEAGVSSGGGRAGAGRGRLKAPSSLCLRLSYRRASLSPPASSRLSARDCAGELVTTSPPGLPAASLCGSAAPAAPAALAAMC